MDLGLSGKNAIIGASSGGLGKACAVELAKEGVNVLICGRRRGPLESTSREIKNITGAKVCCVVADLATEDGQSHVVHKGLQEFGTIDILVTNTGGPPTGRFEVHDRLAWDTAYNLLFASAVSLIRGVLPGMKKNHFGRIIAITSQAVKQPVDNLILSNSMRASIVGLCRTLANELGEFGITVNNVMPGYTRTDRLDKLMAEDPKLENIVDEIPIGRFGEPEELAALVCFLASSRAGFITGVSVPVDGGWIKSII